MSEMPVLSVAAPSPPALRGGVPRSKCDPCSCSRNRQSPQVVGMYHWRRRRPSSKANSHQDAGLSTARQFQCFLAFLHQAFVARAYLCAPCNSTSATPTSRPPRGTPLAKANASRGFKAGNMSPHGYRRDARKMLGSCGALWHFLAALSKKKTRN